MCQSDDNIIPLAYARTARLATETGLESRSVHHHESYVQMTVSTGKNRSNNIGGCRRLLPLAKRIFLTETRAEQGDQTSIQCQLQCELQPESVV